MSDKYPDGYPESEKLQASGHVFGTIQEFLEWLEEEKRIHLCKTLDTGAYYPVLESFQTLAYEFLGVDEKVDVQSLTDKELEKWMHSLNERSVSLRDRKKEVDQQLTSVQREKFRRRVGISVGDCVQYVEYQDRFDWNTRKTQIKRIVRRMKVTGIGKFSISGISIRKDGTKGSQRVNIFLDEIDNKEVQKVQCPEGVS